MSHKFDFGDFTDLLVVIANGKALIEAIEASDIDKPLDAALSAIVSSLSLAATTEACRITL